MATVIGTALPEFLYGTIGNDIVRGLQGDDGLWGFDGHDRLQGGTGDDTLSGGSGNDTLDGGAGEDFFYGGSGSDLVTFASATSGFTLNLLDGSLSTGDAQGDIFFSIERFQLGAFSDRMIASGRSETILGGAGNDTLDGGAGNDSLQGDAGNDVLIGGAGADRLTGGDGIDLASYETAAAAVTINLVNGLRAGDALGDVFSRVERFRLGGFGDRFAGGALAETVLGGAGNDTLDGGAGNDSLQGDAGNDVLIGGAGADRLTGGDGIDLASYETAAAAVTINLVNGLRAGDALGDVFSRVERFRLGGFGDRFAGGALAETVLGGAGNDTLDGGAGNDSLQGDAGNDVLIGGAGADRLTGGDGIDLASYETAAAAVTINLVNGLRAGDALGDVLSSVERFRLGGFGDRFAGGAAADTVFGGAGNDTLEGGAGNDSLQGDAGNDVLIGGAGADRLIGGDGVDTASYEASAAAVTLNLVSGIFSGDALGDVFGSIEALHLSSHDDTVTLSTTLRFVDGGAGADQMTGSSGNDTILGGAGNDAMTGGAGADVLNGGSEFDLVAYNSAVRLDMNNASLSTGEALGDQLVSIEQVLFMGAGGLNTYVGSSLFMEVVAADGVVATAIAGTGAEVFTGMNLVDYSLMTQGVTLISSSGELNGSRGALGDVLRSSSLSSRNVGALTLTSFDDVLMVGSSDLNVLEATTGAGADVITVNGSALQVDLNMGTGDDTVTGFATQIDVLLGDGDDLLNVSSEQPSNLAANVFGGLGNDDITVGGYQTTTVDGGDGHDKLTVSPAFFNVGAFNGPLSVTGGLGDDTISGTAFSGLYSGGDGADSLTIEVRFATAATVTVDGGLGADEIILTSGGDVQPFEPTQVFGGDGADSITAELWLGNLLGGTGDDVIIFTGASTGGFGGGPSTESVLDGGDGNDSLTGNIFHELGGPLNMTGGIGDDTITGTAHRGNYTGGVGDDTMVITGLSPAAGLVTVDGGEGADDITFTSPNVVFSSVELTGGAGNDTIEGSSFGGSYLGGTGDDTMFLHCLIVSDGGVFADGGAGNDTIIMDGTTVGSIVTPGSVDVAGGAGNDAITGMSGFAQTRFRFETDWGNDTLTGFRVAVDKLRFEGIADLNSMDDLTIVGGTDINAVDFTTLTFGDDVITLHGVEVGSITESLFLFV